MNYMNWDKIKSKYPEAWGKFKEKYPYLEINNARELGRWFTDRIHTIRMFSRFNNRDLYDFFDEQKIYVEISRVYECVDGYDIQYTDKWNWLITYINKFCGDEGQKEARIKAESEAFTKAFFILEERLCSQK